MHLSGKRSFFEEMFDIWKNLKDLVHVDPNTVRTTNIVFIVNSKLTVIALTALSILVTSRQYLGDPIDCLSSPDIKSIADKYCWIHSTFTRGKVDGFGKWNYEAGEIFMNKKQIFYLLSLLMQKQILQYCEYKNIYFNF